MLVARLGGWWRLWIVASVIYGAIVAVFNWNSYPRVESISYEASHLKLLSDRTLQILAGRLQAQIPPPPPGFVIDQSSIPKPGWAGDPIILEMPNGQEFKVPANTSTEQSKEVAEDYVRVLYLRANERRISALLHAFLAWAVPCLLVLALGWAVSWIYRGFRRGGA